MKKQSIKYTVKVLKLKVELLGVLILLLEL